MLRNKLDSLPLSAFPTVDKQILIEHFDELITVPDLHQRELREFDAKTSADRMPYRGKYHVVHSSGSTGKPGYFIYDKAAWHTMLLGIIRGALWNMTVPQILKLLAGRPRIIYIAATDGRYGGATGLDFHRCSKINNCFIKYTAAADGFPNAAVLLSALKKQKI